MRQAITTKFLPPTNFKPSRIKARCQRGSIIVPYDHSLNHDSNHIAAARALLDKFANEDCLKYEGTYDEHHWGNFISGFTHRNEGVHVLIPR